MANHPDVEAIDTGEEFVHVRFRDPDEFEEIRTPDWAANAARSISDGAEVRMGRRTDSDDWAVQSVLVKKSVGEEKAREQAQEILDEIES